MSGPRRRNRLSLLGILLVVALIVVSCTSGSSDDSDETEEPASTAGSLPNVELVFNGEGNNLNVFDPATGEEQRVITNAADDPDGKDINGQICFFPDGSGKFIAGEHTGQPEITPGWGIFQLEGERLGELTATQEGKLVPTYQDSVEDPATYGCGFLSDGRALTTDTGNQDEGDEGNGGGAQLIIWFPPFDIEQVAFCKLDVEIATAQQIYVGDDDTVYVASAQRPNNGVLRFGGPFPTSPDAAGGCGQTDATGAPLADSVSREMFIPPEDPIPMPNGVVGSPSGGFYVSSALTGVIAEFDASGNFVRTILEPPPGETIGAQTLSTGTPVGIGIDSAGNLYYADIGLIVTPEMTGPGPEGAVQIIQFVDGEPEFPEVLGFDLEFPDGIGIYTPAKK